MKSRGVLAGMCVLVALAGAMLVGLVRAAEPTATAPSDVPGVKRVELAGIHNAFQIGSRYFTGSVPEGDASFAALAKLGVKTIITVDGAQPDVETAKKHGIRYIHLPHGYDAVSTNAVVQIAKAVTSIEGPVFFHCHHGKHRGPAAAAIACMTTEGWSADRAEAWLKAAGTDTNYAGLYRSVETFRPFSDEALKAIPANLPEKAEVSGMVDAMLEIDTRWDHLKAVRKAGYGALPGHPDIDPANEATILMEHYRETRRLDESKRHGERFLGLLADGERLGAEAAALLRERKAGSNPDVVSKLDRTFDGIAQNCAACHKRFRN